MKQQYAQAFLASIKDGIAIDQAIAGLVRALEKKQHRKLLGSILHEALRVLEADKGGHAVVATATAGDAVVLKDKIRAALKELGMSDTAQVKEVVDETLIGGFVATFDHKEHDASYKKSLKNLYESIVK